MAAAINCALFVVLCICGPQTVWSVRWQSMTIYNTARAESAAFNTTAQHSDDDYWFGSCKKKNPKCGSFGAGKTYGHFKGKTYLDGPDSFLSFWTTHTVLWAVGSCSVVEGKYKEDGQVVKPSDYGLGKGSYTCMEKCWLTAKVKTSKYRNGAMQYGGSTYEAPANTTRDLYTILHDSEYGCPSCGRPQSVEMLRPGNSGKKSPPCIPRRFSHDFLDTLERYLIPTPSQVHH